MRRLARMQLTILMTGTVVGTAVLFLLGLLRHPHNFELSAETSGGFIVAMAFGTWFLRRAYRRAAIRRVQAMAEREKSVS